MKILKKPVTAEAGNHDGGCRIRHPHGMVDRASMIVSSGVFVGYIPVASGTFGSLWVLVLYFVVPERLFANGILVAVPVVYVLGAWTASRCEMFWGKDPGRIVIDEIAGMFLALAGIPLNVKIVWLGFFIFRMCDIVKPPPVRWSERLPRGWGVMTDDIIAGCYANLLLRLLIYVFPWVR